MRGVFKMNKKIKAIIEFVKVHKKETIGVAVALGIAVIGIGDML